MQVAVHRQPALRNVVPIAHEARTLHQLQLKHVELALEPTLMGRDVCKTPIQA
jgi:hypothetical protein